MRQLIAIVALLVLSAGCSTPSTSEAEQAPSPGLPAPVRPNEAKIEYPPVLQSRDGRGIRPCDFLSDEQLQSFGLDPASANQQPVNERPGCVWTTPGRFDSISVTLNPDTTISAIGGIYLTREAYGVFEPGEIGGHPTVRAQPTPIRGCTLYVGVAEHQLLGVRVSAGDRPQAETCPLATRIASAVLSNFPPLR